MERCYLVVEVDVDGADRLEDVHRWDGVGVFLEPSVQQSGVFCVVFHNSVHEVEIFGWDDCRNWTVPVFLTQKHLKQSIETCALHTPFNEIGLKL